MHTAESIQDQAVAKAKKAGLSDPRDITAYSAAYMSQWLALALNELEALKKKTDND